MSNTPLEPKKIDINGREYLCFPFDPMTAMEFIHQFQTVLNNKGDMAAISRRAIGQCRTPGMGRSLSDEAVFLEHFTEFPEDMIDLSSKAIETLIVPFGSKAKNTNKKKPDSPTKPLVGTV